MTQSKREKVLREIENTYLYEKLPADLESQPTAILVLILNMCKRVRANTIADIEVDASIDDSDNSNNKLFTTKERLQQSIEFAKSRCGRQLYGNPPRVHGPDEDWAVMRDMLTIVLENIDEEK